MERRAAIATYRAGFGVLTFAAIATQLVDLSGKGTLNLVSYFSYFTIQSNLIAATVLIVGAARWRVRARPPSIWSVAERSST